MPISEPEAEVRRDEPGQRPLLEVRGLRAGYRGVDILHGVDLTVGQGEIVCVVGPNGSGKSTVFKALYGLIDVREGSVLLDGEDITDYGPQRLLTTGIALVPQQPAIFPSMTVHENIELGMYLERDRGKIRGRVAEVFDLFPKLAARRSQQAGTLSGGERRALEIGRSLMLRPRLVLMDEPSVGLSPVLVREVFEQLRELRDAAGLTFLMIEQNAKSGLELSDRGYVIERGRVTYSGAGSELLGDDEVRRTFLGVGKDD
ncbi:ABC transporter ATP-binding protein [Prauserella cavernicola]|uniref:ABC transporter ATP-binding protein n=1 Tax=Prauserella cavernicola TaxID=2800127 RepID=A0A934V450_9PSEU|nr:ABC transporter ATP-binding protein [Prauserella cavernicola]MBK1783208.1 ABC transporter ATP-binding protein [Prauserella cavernicola]